MSLNRAKHTEIDKLKTYGFEEFVDNGDYFYLINGEKINSCMRFKFDVQLCKDITPKGKVSFSLDTGDRFNVFRTFKDLIYFLDNTLKECKTNPSKGTV